MTPSTSQPQGSSSSFPIAAVGASAGGLQAYIALLACLPAEPGLAIVLIQHLMPDQPSILSDILARETPMPVVQATQGLMVQPNHIYVIPPNQQMTINHDQLRLRERQQRPGKFMPIDIFFKSLAEGYGNRAIGVVLSGFDGDGALGLKAIKETGGITFAQTKDTAQHGEMPNTAIETGFVDFILSPVDIAHRLVEIAQHPYVRQVPAPAEPSNPEPEDSSRQGLPAVYALLRAITGVDFSQYKRATFERRLRRRMALHRLTNLSEYIQQFEGNREEVKALYRDVLITVTSFFRDSEVFEYLQTSVFPALIEQKGPDAPIRFWVAGCATGEECYSLAIALLECISHHDINPPIQIFATDISEEAVDIARQGIYSEAQMVGVSDERRQRFFTRSEGRYHVSKSLRELCIFARQNLASDPPFSNLDLVSCRNVLIYLTPSLQSRVLAVFHYGLATGGYLCLGNSESVGETSTLFSVLDKRHKLYTRSAARSRLSFDFAANSDRLLLETPDLRPLSLPSGASSILNIQRQADQLLLEHYAPAGMLIDGQFEILQFRGNTGPYLQPAPGEPTFNLLKMIRPDLLTEVRSAINQAKTQYIIVYTDRLLLEEGSEALRVKVVPIHNPVSQERHYLLLFEAESQLTAAELIPPEPDDVIPEEAVSQAEFTRQARELAAVRQELADTRAYLRASNEQHEAINQRLTTANEEILSSNEELQSTNEELQTAKEEIQAANEELKTTNEELHSRNSESRRVNNDLINLINNVNIPIVMLSENLRVRRFTPTARRFFNLRPGDLGRSLSDFRLDFKLSNLEDLIQEVLNTLEIKECEVQDSNGRWYQLRIRPYRTADNSIDGVVLALVDVDDIKNTLRQLELARRYAESIAETVQEPFVVLTSDWEIKTVNWAFCEAFQARATAVENQSFLDIESGQWDLPELREALAATIQSGQTLRNLELGVDFVKTGQKSLLFNARVIEEIFDERLVLLSIEDITQRKQAEAQRMHLIQSQAAQAEAELASRQKDEFLSVLSHELRTPLGVISGWVSLLRRQQTINPAMLERAFASIERATQSQTSLISELLEVSRIIQGQVSLQREAVDLTNLLSVIINSFQPNLDGKNLQLLADLAHAPCDLNLDFDRMQQVFSNLLTNAIKFTPEGGQIQVTLIYTDEDAQVEVADTGKGIDPAFLPHVFERFQRAESDNTRTYSGLGLGLSIVKYFVEAHGGQVNAASPGLGQGATFTIRLPRVCFSGAAPGPSAATADVGQLQGRRILVVEDDADNLDLFVQMLQIWGATAIEATSVAQAIEILSEPNLPDLLISDISMPERDGYELIRWLRNQSSDQGGALPAIALTGNAAVEDSQRLLEAGFQHHLVKPVNLNILEAVASHLIASEMRQE